MMKNVNFNFNRVSFGSSGQSVVRNNLPVAYYIAIASDQPDIKQPSSDNYKAYLNIQEISEPKGNELEKNVALAKDAIKYVKSLKLKSSTDMERQIPYIEYHPTEEYRSVVSDILYMNRIRQGTTIDEYVELTKEKAPQLGVGNCSDQAILAANYLIEEKKENNVALIALTLKGQNPVNVDAIDQHVFAVVGLDKNANLKDPDTWGENAVLVDPWGNISDPVKSENPSRSALNKLYALFRTKYMKFDNYSPYIDPTLDPNTPYNWENYRKSL